MIRRFGAAPPRIANVAPAEAHDLARKGTAVIVDVREAHERAEARIPGTIHVPLGELARRVRELPAGRTWILQCRSGARSLAAAGALVAAGHANVANLQGGIAGWATAGLPLET